MFIPLRSLNLSFLSELKSRYVSTQVHTLYILFSLTKIEFKLTFSNFWKRNFMINSLSYSNFDLTIQQICRSPKCFGAGWTSSGNWLKINGHLQIGKRVNKICLLWKIAEFYATQLSSERKVYITFLLKLFLYSTYKVPPQTPPKKNYFK